MTIMTSAEHVPEFAYTWRPYANSKMIYKEIRGPAGPAYFTIDPWTQRWAILDTGGKNLLQMADGKRRLSAIIRSLESDATLAPPFTGYAQLAVSLQETGLLFANQAEHKVQGEPVYSKSDLTGLHLEVTNACNMSCTHCYVASGNKLPGELTLDEIYKTIDMLPPFSGQRVAISGGEPVVRKDLIRIIDYCVVKCGHQVDLYTNGWKFPENIAKQILEINTQHGDMIRVQMSLEGATSETNDAVRGKNGFAEALKTLKMFQRIGLNRSVVVFVCITRHNIDELDEIIALAEAHDIAMLVFSQWQKQGNASDTPWASIAPSLDQWVRAGEKLLAYNNPRLTIFGNFFGDLRNNEFGRYSLDRPLFPKHVYYYNSFPRVAPDGDVWADQLWVDRDWVLGNVRTDDLQDCFDKPSFYDQLGQFRDRISHIPECQKCEWRELCQGGSPGHTYAEYGHMREKDLFCEARIYWFNRYVEHHTQQTFSQT
jgi:radical SAM protein with 4Fe4S-binding SPASM domain